MTAINRILIVDDEDNVRRMLSTAFALQGFEHIVRTTDAQHYTCLPIFTLMWC